jgi:hypothetical protein
VARLRASGTSTRIDTVSRGFAILFRFIDELARIPRSKDPKLPSRPRDRHSSRASAPSSWRVFPRCVTRHYPQPRHLSELVLCAVYDTMSGMARRWDLERLRGARPELLRDPPSRAGIPRAVEGLPDGAHVGASPSERVRKDRASRVRSGSSRLLREAEASPPRFWRSHPTVGLGVDAQRGYHGILLLGPFNCLALRISEAILKPLCYRLSCPSDVRERWLRRASRFPAAGEVHIQQVLDAFDASGQAQAEASRRGSKPEIRSSEYWCDRGGIRHLEQRAAGLGHPRALGAGPLVLSISAVRHRIWSTAARRIRASRPRLRDGRLRGPAISWRRTVPRGYSARSTGTAPDRGADVTRCLGDEQGCLISSTSIT